MNSARRFIYPAITALVLIGIWIISISYFKVPNYILPRPGDVLDALYVGYVQGQYWQHFFFTLQCVVLGYLLGCGLGALLGTLLAESRTFELFVYPYIVALQSMPKIAIAPLILVWFGFGVTSKVVMVALMCFFPMFVNTLAGIRQADPEMLNMLRAYKASRAFRLFHVKLPAASGHIFAGLQISVVLALIGAVVAEFVSSTMGLGFLIQAAALNIDVATMFAALLSLVAIGIGGTQFMRWAHRRVAFWDQGDRSSAAAE